MDNKPLDMSGLPQEKQPPSAKSLQVQLFTLIESPSFQQSYSALPTTYERIKFVLSHEIVRLVIGEFVANCNNNAAKKQQQQDESKKSAAQVTKFCEEGTRDFEAHRYEDALLSYTKSIRYAPHDSGMLPIALGNRSGAYFQLKQYEAALQDIEAAQSHPQYKPFFMLTIRRCQCLVRLGRLAEAKKIVDLINRSKLGKIEDALWDRFYRQEGEQLMNAEEKVEYKNNNILEPKLLKSLSSVIKILSEKGRFEPQSSNSSLSSKVEVRYDKKNGRHLVTTCDVHFGDILAVTQPYASVLSSEQELQFCHHCLTSLKYIPDNLPRSVPCTQCTRVLYCSEHCRTESWQSYHRFECPLSIENSFDHAFSGNNSDLRLVLRTLFVAGGLESIRAVTQKLDPSGDPSKSTDFTVDPIGSYENVYRITKKEDYTIPDYIKTMVRIVFLYKWTKLTDANLLLEAASPLDISTIEALLRHYQQIYSNISLFVRADQSALDNPTASYESIYTLDPLISLVRESCNPNITIHVVDCARPAPHVSNVCVFFAIKPIAAGTVLTGVGLAYGDAVKYRIHLDDYVKWQHECWNHSEHRYICTCEHCEGKRRDSPLGSSTSTSLLDGHELICCGPTCGGFIRRTDGGKVNCCTCKREIGHTELAELKKISKKIVKVQSEAIDLINRAKNSIVNYKQKENLPKELTTVLHQLETLTNERIAPLAVKHSRRLLVALYKQLSTFYLYCNKMDEPNSFAHLQKAWKYADASHTTLDGHFGGDSLTLFVLLQKDVGSFSKMMGELGLELLEPVGPMVRGRYWEFRRLNLNEDSQDEDRNNRIRLVNSFHCAQKRLDKMKECYELI